jgi:hypothetical protein
MKCCGIEIEIDRRTIMVSIGDRCFGIGWWVKGHWKRLDGWLLWSRFYYHGNRFACRLGPFFYSRGPF